MVCIVDCTDGNLLDSDSDDGSDDADNEYPMRSARSHDRRAGRRMSALAFSLSALLIVWTVHGTGIHLHGLTMNLDDLGATLRVAMHATTSKQRWLLDGPEVEKVSTMHEHRRLSSTGTCERNTGTRCFAEGSTIVSLCDQDRFGVQVQCDIKIDGGLYRGVEGNGGECLCPTNYCRENGFGGKCIAQTGHVPWTSSYVTTDRSARLTYALNAANDTRRKELTMQAIEECEGVPYASTIVLFGNAQQSRCVYAREVIETCGYKVATFWLNNLVDQGGKDRFLKVTLVGLLLSFVAKICVAIILMYLATVFFQDEVVDLLVKAGKKSHPDYGGPTWAEMTAKQRAGWLLTVVLKFILVVGGIYVILQLVWIAVVNTIVFLDKHREFMEAIKDLDMSSGKYQDPCRFWMSAHYIQYGQLAELLGLCFTSWFDVLCWIIVAVWTLMLCISSCCWTFCCCCSYIWCCVCCKNCTCACFCCMIIFGMCGSCMIIIISLPMIVLVIAFLICVAVWLLLVALCLVVILACMAIIGGMFLLIAYALARVIAAVFRLEWPFTFTSFVKMWKDNLVITIAVLVAGDKGLEYMGVDPDRAETFAEIELVSSSDSGSDTKYFSTAYLMYVVKTIRLVLIFALLIPLGVTVLLLLTELIGQLSFKRFVAAQMTELRYPPYSPPPDENYDVGEHWRSFFEDYFPDLVKTLFETYLGALYVGVPNALVKATGNAFDDIKIDFPSPFQIWKDFADTLENIDSRLDIDKFIDLNYYARVLIAAVEGLLLFASLVVSSLRPVLEKLADAAEEAGSVAETVRSAAEDLGENVASAAEEVASIQIDDLQAIRARFDDLLAGGDGSDIDLDTFQKMAEVVTNDQLTLLLQTNNIPELALLLGLAPVADMKRFKKLTKAIKQNDMTTVNAMGNELVYDDLLRQDGEGNIALHHVTSPEMFQYLRAINPESIQVQNDNGETPIAIMIRRGLKMNELFPNKEEGSARCLAMQLLTPDKNVICPAMTLSADNPLRIELEGFLPQWEDVLKVLLAETSEELDIKKQGLVDTFNELQSYGSPGAKWPIDVWYISFCLNCFGEEEVWSKGVHTARSTERLAIVGDCLHMLLSEYETLGRSSEDNNNVANLIRDIFLSTKGPNTPGWDGREPYWTKIKALLDEMAARTKAGLDDAYAKLTPAITSDIPKFQMMDESYKPTVCKLMSNEDAKRSAELRQDFGNLWPHKSWTQVFESSTGISIPPLTQAAKDLLALGSLKGVDAEELNAAADFQKICEGKFNKKYKVVSDSDLQVMRCDAQFRRDTCNKYQSDVKNVFVRILSDCNIEPIGANIQARPVAKGMSRLLEKVHELLAEVEKDTLIFERARAAKQEKELNFQLRTAGDFIVDVNGVTLIVDTEEQFTALFEYIKTKTYSNDGCELLRVKNAFHHTKESPFGYRDTKLWVAVDPFRGKQSKESFPMVCEVQLHLRQFYSFKERLMHLHYEIIRGSFDHPHTQALRESKASSSPLPDTVPGTRKSLKKKRASESSRKKSASRSSVVATHTADHMDINAVVVGKEEASPNEEVDGDRA